MRLRTVFGALAVLGGVLVWHGGRAGAQQALVEDDKVLAESLFTKGRELLQAGEIEEACRHFERSQRLVRAAGTLLNLAVCHEQEGKLATAWAEYDESLRLALAMDVASRVAFARRRMQELLPRLARLRIDVSSSARVPGLRVMRGQTSVPEAVWGTAVPVDPGEVRVTAAAAGRRPWERHVTLSEGQELTVTVQGLEPLRAEVATSTQPVARPQEKLPQAEERRRDASSPYGALRTTAWVGGAAGIALVGAGAYFGVQALRKRSESDDYCHGDGLCYDEGVRLNDQAYEKARTCNILLGSGILLTGISAFALLGLPTEPDGREAVGDRRGDAPASRSAVTVAAGHGGIDANVTVRW